MALSRQDKPRREFDEGGRKDRRESQNPSPKSNKEEIASRKNLSDSSRKKNPKGSPSGYSSREDS